MGKKCIEVDAMSVARCVGRMEDLRVKEMKGVLKGALKRGGGILVKETKKELAGRSVKYASPSKKLRGKSVSDGVRMSVAKDVESAKVSVMGNFLARIFEVGTRPRYTGGNRSARPKTKRRYRAGVHRGRIVPMAYFAAAQVRCEQKIESAMDRYIMTAVNRKWEKGK